MGNASGVAPLPLWHGCRSLRCTIIDRARVNEDLRTVIGLSCPAWQDAPRASAASHSNDISNQNPIVARREEPQGGKRRAIGWVEVPAGWWQRSARRAIECGQLREDAVAWTGPGQCCGCQLVISAAPELGGGTSSRRRAVRRRSPVDMR